MSGFKPGRPLSVILAEKKKRNEERRFNSGPARRKREAAAALKRTQFNLRDRRTPTQKFKSAFDTAKLKRNQAIRGRKSIRLRDVTGLPFMHPLRKEFRSRRRKKIAGAIPAITKILGPIGKIATRLLPGPLKILGIGLQAASNVGGEILSSRTKKQKKFGSF